MRRMTRFSTPTALLTLASALGCGAGDGRLSEELGTSQQALASCATSDNPAWATSKTYAVGARVSYGGKVYECLQAHTSQTGWEPTNTPSLWRIPSACATSAWAAQTSYLVGSVVQYNGKSYKCLQAHTSLVGWEPPNTPALWQVTSSLPPPVTTERALILIDSRLYSRLSARVTQYRDLARQRRGFGIALQSIDGLDDWTFDAVRSYIKQQRAGDPALEGLLFIGNIKVPSFFQSRTDSADTRLIPRYYEDLDGVFTKRLAVGSTIPQCPVPFVDTYNCFSSPFTVPAHDFDFVQKGPATNPEIWTSYMPVGRDGVNTYDSFAAQLGPYLDKVIRYYQGQLVSNGRFYFVSGDVGEEPEKFWDAFTKFKFDFYGKPGPNGEVGGACFSGTTNLCYARWPAETYPDVASFLADVRRQWVGEGWQEDTIFIQHTNAALYDVVEINTHANEFWSLVSSTQAASITKGGLFTALDGCGVAGFAQPGSPSYVNTSASVATNLMMSFLYGSSQAIAATGDPFWRGHYAKNPTIYKHLKTTPGGYLGRAHLERNKEQYQRANSDGEHREFGMEMLAGDPFMNL